MFRIRCSALHSIMTDPKDPKKNALSVGAMSYVEDLAREFVYQYQPSISDKKIEKGQIVEPQSIALLNEVLFTNYEKNTVRLENDWLTGECDINAPTKIHDIKSPWSLQTFPATVFTARKLAEKAGYDYQVAGYMWLYDKEEAEIDYCLVNTPDELIGYDDTAVHYVDHIDPALRLTRVQFKRDLALEDKIKSRVDACREYFEKVVQTIAEEHA